MNMAPHDMPQSHVVPYGDTPVYLDKVKPLDPNLFSLSEEAATFFKASTGINDDEELKKHILITQEMAYRVAPYPCIYGFGYLRSVILLAGDILSRLAVPGWESQRTLLTKTSSKLLASAKTRSCWILVVVVSLDPCVWEALLTVHSCCRREEGCGGWVFCLQCSGF